MTYAYRQVLCPECGGLAPSTFERVADALGSRVGLAFYCGAYVGALLTVALAYAWGAAL